MDGEKKIHNIVQIQNRLLWSIDNTDVSIFIYPCACNKIGVFEVTAFGWAPTPTVICVGECRSLSLMESMNQLLVHRLQKTAQQREREGERGQRRIAALWNASHNSGQARLSLFQSFLPSISSSHERSPSSPFCRYQRYPTLIFIQSLHSFFFHLESQY